MTAHEPKNNRAPVPLLLGFCLAVLVAAATMAAPLAPEGLRIYWIDVEGGAATLLVTPAGESILVDTGMPGQRDPGRINKLAREVAGLTKIDHLVITHFDLDHYGGAADLSRLIPIGRVYDHGMEGEGIRRPPAAYFDFKADKRVVLRPGDRLPLRQLNGGTKIEATCLAALRRFAPAGGRAQRTDVKTEPQRRAVDKSQNGNSIVLLVRFGAFDFLDAADLTWNLEAKLVWPVDRVGEVDVFQVNHHGLDSSNHPAMVRSIRPRVAIMNNGDRKGCQPGTFRTLKQVPSIEAIYQVHRNLRSDGENNTLPKLIANTAPKKTCPGHHIALHVASDGRSYRVLVPSTGHAGDYTCR